MRKVKFIDLGLVDYKEAWDYQTKLFDEIIALKMKNRDLPEDEQEEVPNYLILCSHPHVYTLGKSGVKDNLLLDNDGLEEKEASFYKINRGGDITYHGPGQIVAYPIFDLDQFFTDIHKYLRYLEEAVILTLGEYNIKGGRVNGLTGVWIDAEETASSRKICAMGVKCSRWVTMHGLALNVNVDLSYFSNIIPCGIDDRAVTSMQQENTKELPLNDVKDSLKDNLANIFDFDYI